MKLIYDYIFTLLVNKHALFEEMEQEMIFIDEYSVSFVKKTVFSCAVLLTILICINLLEFRVQGTLTKSGTC
jgi:hypothetical protein